MHTINKVRFLSYVRIESVAVFNKTFIFVSLLLEFSLKVKPRNSRSLVFFTLKNLFNLTQNQTNLVISDSTLPHSITYPIFSLKQSNYITSFNLSLSKNINNSISSFVEQRMLSLKFSKSPSNLGSFSSRDAGSSVSSDDYIPGKPFLRAMIMMHVLR